MLLLLFSILKCHRPGVPRALPLPLTLMASRATILCSKIRWLFKALRRSRENLETIGRNPNRVLELSRRLAVPRPGRPAIAFIDFDAISPDVQHGLNGKQHAGHQFHALPWLTEVEDVRRHVELLAKAMSDELPDD